jgi:hypothetical protein
VYKEPRKFNLGVGTIPGN